MNTYTFSISTISPNVEKTYGTIDLFDQTNFTIDMSDVYAAVFPNYIAFNWGDDSPIEEPDIKIFRNYKTESIYPEVLNGASPVFLNKKYSHIYYPSDFALKKSMTLRINIGYITGALTQLTVPIAVRAESYYDTIGDMEIAGIDILNDENNSSRFTFLTKKDNHLIQADNTTEKAEQVFADRIPSAEGSESFFSPTRRRAKKGPRSEESRLSPEEEKKAALSAPPVSISCPENMRMNPYRMRLLLDSPYLDSIGFWAPKYMKRVKDMLRKCYEESLFLSDEELGEHINNRPDLWGSVPIPKDLLRYPRAIKPELMSDEELREFIDNRPDLWGSVPIPEDLLRYPRVKPNFLSDEELREHINNRPDLWGSVPIREPKPGGWGLPGPAGFYPPIGDAPGFHRRQDGPWIRPGRIGLRPLPDVAPWTVHPWDPHGRPGDIDIRPDQPGMQIPFDEYMRRKIPADRKAKKQRDLEEALKEAQKSPMRHMLDGALFWYKFLFTPGGASG